MSEQGRGSAGTIGVVVVLCLMVQLGCSNAATYKVGESGGWSFNTDSWPNGKQFRAGDVLCKFLTYPREILIPYESKCKLYKTIIGKFSNRIRVAEEA